MYLVGTKAQCIAWRAALAKADGLPKRGVVYFDGVRRPDLDSMVPQEYAPGAPGWTDHVCEEPVEGVSQAALIVPTFAEKHLGKNVDAVRLPERASGVEEDALPADVRDKLRDRREGRETKDPPGRGGEKEGAR